MNDLNAILLLAILVATPVYLICSGIRMMTSRKSPFTPVKEDGFQPIPQDLWTICGIWQDSSSRLWLIQYGVQSNRPVRDLEALFADWVVNAIPAIKTMRRVVTQTFHNATGHGGSTQIQLGAKQA